MAEINAIWITYFYLLLISGGGLFLSWWVSWRWRRWARFWCLARVCWWQFVLGVMSFSFAGCRCFKLFDVREPNFVICHASLFCFMGLQLFKEDHIQVRKSSLLLCPEEYPLWPLQLKTSKKRIILLQGSRNTKRQ